MKNQYLSALKEQANLTGMAGIITLAAMSGSVLPVLVGAVAEALYLVVFPDSKWYQAKLKAQEEKTNNDSFRTLFNDKRQEALYVVSAPVKERYYTLEHIRGQVSEASADRETWYIDVLRKLDQMLLAFLNFGIKEAQFRGHLYSAVQTIAKQHKNKKIFEKCPDDANLEEVEAWARDVAEFISQNYAADVAVVEEKINTTNAADPNLPILQKRVEMIRKRGEYAGKVGRMLVSMHHQMRLLEDTFGLISDEAQSRPPQQVLSDIDEAVFQSTLLTDAIDEFSGSDQTLNVGA